MTLEQFEARYGEDSRYEFWFGKAVDRNSGTTIHGLLQQIIAKYLSEAGLISGCAIELRIVREAHPRPDVIATGTKPSGKYPKKGWEVAVEILSEDDRVINVRSHCKQYQAWGFEHVYIVDPSDRSVVECRDGAQTPVNQLAGIAVSRIWEELDRQYDPHEDGSE